MKNLIFFGCAILILIGLFLMFRPDGENAQNTQKIFSLEIRDKKIINGSSDLKVNEGDQVTIKIKTDAEEEFHLHGYDRAVDIKPDAEAQLSFVANFSGRFEFELEKSKTSLGALEVQP